MKGVTIAKPGAPYEVTTDLEKPVPGKGQVLVKSLFAGINPVENFQQSGILVNSWPAVIGCDASGVVVEVGEGVRKFKVGDAVWGCTRLGTKGYGTFQEYFLMDDYLALLKPGNVSLEQAATLGVASLTASLGLIGGLHLRFPEKGEDLKFDKWVIVLGGSGSVGQLAVQIVKLCGYKVLASCSPSNETLVKSLGADGVLDYKLDLPAQVSHVESITGGNFSGVFDSTATSHLAAFEFLTRASKLNDKRFATVDDWSTITSPPTLKTYRVTLGKIGQPGPPESENAIVTAAIASYIPYLEMYVTAGRLKPQGAEVVGEGFESVGPAVGMLGKGGVGGGKKIVVKLQDE